MSEEENKVLVRRVIEEMFNEGNLDVADELIAPDYVDHDPAMPEADDVDAVYCNERPSRGSWLSEPPPTGVLTGVLGEMAFYYGAWWLYQRSTPPHRGKTR